MKKRYAFLTSILTGVIILACLGFTSCKEQAAGSVQRVLVIHQNESTPQEYGVHVEKYYKESLQKHHIANQVEMRHFYLNYPQMTQYYSNYIEELRQEGWIPDIVICHKDVSLNYYMKSAMKFGEGFQQIPVLYCGVRYPEGDISLDGYGNPTKFFKHITGFRDSVHFGKNLKFFQEVTGNGLCTVITDSVARATKTIYKDLNEYLRQNPNLYVNNLDCHIKDLYTLDGQHRHNNNKMIVTAISFMYPQLNGEEGEKMMQYALATAKEYRFLQVNYTAGSQVLLDQSDKPQLSVTNAQFNETQKLRILGGYFVSLPQEVNDVVGLLARVIHGEKAESIPETNHHADYWLDWNAMKMWDMKYNDWKDKANIINAPLRVSNPFFWTVRTTLLWGFIIALFGFIIYNIQHWLMNRRDLIQKRKLDDQILWLMASDDCALWSLEKNTLFLRSNFNKLKGFCDRPIPVDSFIEQIHPDSRSYMEDMLHFNINEGNHHIRFKMSLDNGKSYQWWECVYNLSAQDVVFRKAKGRLVYVENIVRREQTLQEQLQAAEEANLKQSFLANISHDIRNPLNSIVGFSDLLIGDDSFTPEEQQEFCDLIRQNTNIMLKLIDDVVNISKVQVGDYRYIRNAVSVNSLIDTAYAANAVLSHDNLKFQKKLDKNDAFIYVDFERTMQVLNNFLNNAFKYTTNGTVIIGWKKVGDHVHLYVHDTGVGISDDKQLKVFDQYYMGDEGHHGTGLGLFIVKMIVEQQGGKVGVESHLGKGSYFYASFPIYYGE